MSSDLWLLITMVRKEDMQLLRYVHQSNRDTNFGQNYMYWNEDDIAKTMMQRYLTLIKK